MVLNPGESTTVAVSFTMHAGMDGPHDFRLHLPTNDPAEPDREIVILSNWTQ
ncbi:MAG: hypothetical protein OEX97_01065 [Acidimicrobiia bacterium]|nr:hypothetical protein [Acidimicrobiia bacterium]